MEYRLSPSQVHWFQQTQYLLKFFPLIPTVAFNFPICTINFHFRVPAEIFCHTKFSTPGIKYKQRTDKVREKSEFIKSKVCSRVFLSQQLGKIKTRWKVSGRKVLSRTGIKRISGISLLKQVFFSFCPRKRVRQALCIMHKGKSMASDTHFPDLVKASTVSTPKFKFGELVHKWDNKSGWNLVRA